MENVEVMTRLEAAERGLKKYRTGKPCSKGHNTYRYTATGSCAACVRGYQDRYRTLQNMRSAGVTEITLLVDVRDEQTVREYADALRIAHQIEDGQKLPIPPVATPPHLPPFPRFPGDTEYEA